MTTRQSLSTTLKRLLGRPTGTNAVRGTWRDVRPAPLSYRPYNGPQNGPMSAFHSDKLPGFYRSEAFAEDLY
nr:hypothetical protein [uncultured Roseateles sp.]